MQIYPKGTSSSVQILRKMHLQILHSHNVRCSGRGWLLVMAVLLGFGCDQRHPLIEKLEYKCATKEDVRACFSLADELTRGTVTNKDAVRATDLVRRADALGRQQCRKKGKAETCHLMGARYYVGTISGLEVNKSKARSYFDRGCRLRSRRACQMQRILMNEELRAKLDESAESRDSLLTF